MDSPDDEFDCLDFDELIYKDFFDDEPDSEIDDDENMDMMVMMNIL